MINSINNIWDDILNQISFTTWHILCQSSDEVKFGTEKKPITSSGMYYSSNNYISNVTILNASICWKSKTQLEKNKSKYEINKLALMVINVFYSV